MKIEKVYSTPPVPQPPRELLGYTVFLTPLEAKIVKACVGVTAPAMVCARISESTAAAQWEIYRDLGAAGVEYDK